MRKSFSKELQEFVLEKYDEVRELPVKERNEIIIQAVKEKFNEVIDRNNIYDICQRIGRIRAKIKEINESVNEFVPYEVVDGHYIFNRKDGAPFKFSVDEIDQMFLDFSKKGNDLSGEQMLAKYQLKPEAWHMIKNRLRLYKDSNVISPYTAENTPEAELDDKIEFAIARHIDSIKGKMVKTFDKQFAEQAKRSFRTLWNIDYFLEHLRTFITQYEPIKIDFVPEAPKNQDIKHFVMADIHIGKLNTKQVINRINVLHNDIVNSEESIIYLTILWDLVETVAQGGMHPGQIEYGMDYQYGFGFDLIMNTVKIFEWFIASLYKHGKKVIVNGITGNHGRMTGAKDMDVRRTAELVIYEMIKRWLANIDVDLKYHEENINTFWHWNLHYIIYHGDGFVDKQKPEQIIVAHGAIGKHNILLSGDKHNVKMSEGANFTYIKVPALAGQGKYDKDMNLHSAPGYIQIQENEWGDPNILVRRVK